MRSSTVISLLGAASVVVASPVHKALHKKAIVYDVHTDIVVVTVTEGGPSMSTVSATSVVVVPFTPSTTSSPPPPPAPTTSSTPTVVVVTYSAPASTSSAAVFLQSSTSVAAAATTAVSSDTGFTGAAVDSHNNARSSHQAPSVVWNETLASYAAITANTCVFAHDM